MTRAGNGSSAGRHRRERGARSPPKPAPRRAANCSIASRSDGATRNAPATRATIHRSGAACRIAATPEAVADQHRGPRRRADRRDDASDPGVLVRPYQSSCSTRRAVLRLRTQRDCQWSGPESDQPGTIRISTSLVRMVRSRRKSWRVGSGCHSRVVRCAEARRVARNWRGTPNSHPSPYRMMLGFRRHWSQSIRLTCLASISQRPSRCTSDAPPSP